MITFNIPWPPKELSPNYICHWRKKKKFKDYYKYVCFNKCKEYLCKNKHASIDSGSATSLTLIFYPPDNRVRDIDNLVACIKSGIDGFCKSMSIDDREFRSLTTRIEKSDKNARIIVVVGK